MNSLIKAVAVALVLAAPVASFAQSNQPLTRAEVRAQLIQVEKAGYRPGVSDPYYPTDIQAAEARVAAQNPVAQADQSGFGGVVSGSSASGVRSHGNAAVGTDAHSVYFGQ
ncbi:DUF4148 domain-containing protein [Paraburkholderia sp. BCC1886]|uniref:DUF4148 domain-containing protein n=1 Tax=Paraburkholderia sp. BCC1886 TaxID=2562670 RepID=UPI001183E6D0|nr:DUF4148 domain-containing protein [Paraburkholderia sp. BCC1886]